MDERVDIPVPAFGPTNSPSEDAWSAMRMAVFGLPDVWLFRAGAGGAERFRSDADG